MGLDYFRDRLAAALMGAAVLLVVALPALMLTEFLQEGLPRLSWEFLVGAPADAGRAGGIGSLILSTVWILGVCLGAALPLGLGCALFLSECVPAGSRAARWLGYSLDVLGGVPYVFGLFGYRFFAVELNLGFSILSGGLTLACMVLPLFIRTSEEALRATPLRHRQAAAALGVTRSGFVRRVLLPSAAPGMAVGVILSVGRALAETAALLFTAGYVTRLPDSVFDSGRALSVHIYDLSMNVSGGEGNAAATATVLLGLLILINLVARNLGHYWQRMDQT
jgi:phosphate transport system permease protein